MHPNDDDDDLFVLRESNAPDGPKLKADGTIPIDPNAGHRQRLRDKFEYAGAKALADYELLELFLFRSIPRRDTKPISRALLKRFKSFPGVMGADIERLCEVQGVGKSVALDLKIVAAAAKQMTKQQVASDNIMSSWRDVLNYCTAVMAHEPREMLRVLFLDKKNKLLADEVQQSGTVDHTPVYPREIMRRAIELSATGIVLAHNHPSGDPTPSNADIEMTKKIISIAAELGITVHDHLIIGREGHVSLKGLGLI